MRVRCLRRSPRHTPTCARVPACGWGSSLPPGVPGRRLGQPPECKLVLHIQGGVEPWLHRALMSRPRLLLMDEPTLGLSPILCEAVMESVVKIKQRGTSLLLSEQNAELALEVSDEGYIMRLGEIVLHGTSRELVSDERVRKAYLGM